MLRMALQGRWLVYGAVIYSTLTRSNALNKVKRGTILMTLERYIKSTGCTNPTRYKLAAKEVLKVWWLYPGMTIDMKRKQILDEAADWLFKLAYSRVDHKNKTKNVIQDIILSNHHPDKIQRAVIYLVGVLGMLSDDNWFLLTRIGGLAKSTTDVFLHIGDVTNDVANNGLDVRIARALLVTLSDLGLLSGHGVSKIFYLPMDKIINVEHRIDMYKWLSAVHEYHTGHTEMHRFMENSSCDPYPLYKFLHLQ